MIFYCQANETNLKDVSSYRSGKLTPEQRAIKLLSTGTVQNELRHFRLQDFQIYDSPNNAFIQKLTNF
jgi:hypothetical protein